jgi:hypothetical protein
MMPASGSIPVISHLLIKNWRVGLKDRGQGDPCGSVQESIREKFNGHDGNLNRPHKKNE